MSAVSRAIGVWFAVLGATFLGACAPSLPPITASPTDQHHPGKFVWFELLSEDPDAAATFYGSVFGWTFEDSGTADYRLIRNGGTAIGGLTSTDDLDAEFTESRWLTTVSVEDVDAAVDRVESAGGEVLVEPVDVRQRGRLAAVRDPAGAELVLLRSKGGDPRDGSASPPGSFLWTDLWTDDAGGARSFYHLVLGYDTRTHTVGRDHRYEIMARDGLPRAGVIVVDLEGIESNWLPYVRVADVPQTLERARKSGGYVLLERGHLAVVVDPTGAAIGVQRRKGKGGSGS